MAQCLDDVRQVFIILVDILFDLFVDLQYLVEFYMKVGAHPDVGLLDLALSR